VNLVWFGTVLVWYLVRTTTFPA